MNTNRYPGTCAHCQISVPANTGIYDYGTIYCTQTHMNDAEQAWHEKKAREDADLEIAQRTIIIPGCIANYSLTVKQVAGLVSKVTKKRTTSVDDLERAEVILFLGAMHKFNDRATRADEVRELKSDGKCVRCSGAGGADMWRDTGWTCYSCGGSGLLTKVTR
jgi:hypothetical protein